MAGEPAIRKVLDRLHSWLDGQLGSGVALLLDRRDPLHDEDLNYVILRCDHTAFSVFDYGSMKHEASIKFDIVTAETSTTTINEVQAEIAAKIVTRMWAMAPTAGTIGELLQDKLPLSMGADQNEFDLTDAGETTFSWAVTWLTPIDDFRTIIGAAGLVP